MFAWEVEGYSLDIALPDEASELVPPSSDDEVVTSRPYGGERTIEVPAHGVRLFVW